MSTEVKERNISAFSNDDEVEVRSRRSSPRDPAAAGSSDDDNNFNLVLHQRVLILRQKMAKLAWVMTVWPLTSFCSYILLMFFMASGIPLGHNICWFIGITTIIVANVYCLSYLCDEVKQALLNIKEKKGWWQPDLMLGKWAFTRSH